MQRWEINPSDKRHQVPRKILERARIPRRYWTATLDFLPPNEAKQKLVAYMEELDKKLNDGRGLFLHGPFGTGKTAAASLVLVEVLSRSSNRVVFAQSAQLDWMARHRDETDENGVPWWMVRRSCAPGTTTFCPRSSPPTLVWRTWRRSSPGSPASSWTATTRST
jgi:ATPase subunit of ABC transporter with duplicated ATPase domains